MANAVVTDRFITANGLRLHYVDWGSLGAPDVVMLHGLRGQARTWDGLARELAGSFHVIALDQRGRGESDWSPGAEYSTAAYVADLSSLVAQLGLGRFVLVGHSMGGANAIVYAAEHPDHVRALVVEDMGPREGREPPPGAGRIASELDATPLDFESWAAAEVFCREERPGISDEALRNRLDNALKQLPGGRVTWKYDLAGIREARRRAGTLSLSMDHVRALRCPVLVLRGAQSDILLPDVAKAMAEANPNLRVTDVPGAGHFVHDDNPEFFNREVRRFVDGLA